MNMRATITTEPRISRRMSIILVGMLLSPGRAVERIIDKCHIGYQYSNMCCVYLILHDLVAQLGAR